MAKQPHLSGLEGEMAGEEGTEGVTHYRGATEGVVWEPAHSAFIVAFMNLPVQGWAEL